MITMFNMKSNMSWRNHVMKIGNKACKRLNLLKPLKYKLNRSTLICLYKSLIRPLLEYADAIWDNCSKADQQLLEHIQYEAARVVTGAIKGTSSNLLREELAWDELRSRRKVHKLILFYKIVSKLSPSYLSALLPETVGQRSSCFLRSSSNLSLFPCRTERFLKSFFPSTVKLWNYLDLQTRDSGSLLTFKRVICKKFLFSKYDKLFDYSLSRIGSVLHARLRLKACALNDYLFQINCSPSPKCRCGMENESVMHFFFTCPLYAAQRHSLFTSAALICGSLWLNVSSKKQKLNWFLYGCEDLDLKENCQLFHEVQNYILATKRFLKTND